MTVGNLFLSTGGRYAVANFHTPFLPAVADRRYNTGSLDSRLLSCSRSLKTSLACLNQAELAHKFSLEIRA
jgi:hypothetical protein